MPKAEIYRVKNGSHHTNVPDFATFSFVKDEARVVFGMKTHCGVRCRRLRIAVELAR
jgi:hypothetical protein